MIRFTQTLILVLCFCHRLAFAQAEPSVSPPASTPGAGNLFPASFARLDGVWKNSTESSKKTFALELGPKLLEVKASYWERRQDDSAGLDGLRAPLETRWGRYFDLLAASSQFGGKLVGEGEVAYSALGASAFNDQQPLMKRLALHGRWGKVGYGMSSRSFGPGFVSQSGVKVEHAREESQLWAEYDFGLFRIRGAGGEMWEDNSATHQITLTRTAATSIYLNKPNWNATLSSSYSLIGDSEAIGQKTVAFANGFSLAYRPAPQLTLEPNVNFKQEWAPITRLKTDTPSAGFGLAYTPSRNLQLIGRASYARDLSEDPLRTGSILNATTGLNWKLGKSFLGEQSLSLQLEYKNEFRSTLPDNQQASLTGIIQFKILGF